MSGGSLKDSLVSGRSAVVLWTRKEGIVFPGVCLVDERDSLVSGGSTVEEGLKLMN